MQKVRIGLIGDNIAASKAPRLHALAGRMRGVEVTYDLLIPAEQGAGFDELFDHCATGDYHGINVTYPYKERAAARVRIDEPLVRAMGAVNTVVFTSDGPRGFNTDHTGFVTAWRAAFGPARPGPVCQVGAGGVGRAVAFGLAALGAEAVRLVDLDRARAERLAAALREARPETQSDRRPRASKTPRPAPAASSTALRSAWSATMERRSHAGSWAEPRGPSTRSTPRSTPVSSPKRRRPASTP